jgi:cytochrome c2
MKTLCSAGIALALLNCLPGFAAIEAELPGLTERRADWAGFVETNFPFFSSVLDARALGRGLASDNLTPRGLVLNLGHGCWACFDTELLRLSAIWTGDAVTPVSMAQGSYHTPGVKAPEGQEKLPEIAGTPWMANGIYPAWQSGGQLSGTDPREPGPDNREIGRGPLAPLAGRFKAVRLTRTGAVLEYEIAGAQVRERFEAQSKYGRPVIHRYFELDRVPHPLWLVLGQLARNGLDFVLKLSPDTVAGHPTLDTASKDGLYVVRLETSQEPVRFNFAIGRSMGTETWDDASQLTAEPPAPVRWPQSITARGTLSPAKDAYVVDNIGLPLDNPWRRNLRFADIAFFADGRAALVTFDGDVWLVSGLEDDLRKVTWRRFASGLHEPLSIAVRGNDVFVFDRNGIWRLRDTDGNGEADAHELISNAFTQTAETREFANGMRLAPDGSFIIAKGGQQGSTLGRDNGTVLRVSADGASATTLGWGLRQPFIGVHPETGLITASDQQGHYVPATPLHIIRDHQFYGFISTLLPKEKYPAPIAEPLTWIPHPINASGAGQVWLTGAKMGSLDGALIHLGYYRPEIFLVRLNHRGARPQAAVISITRELDFAPLNGAVNPRDGQLYVTGFQIWGTTAKQVSGLARLHYTGAPGTLPLEVAAMDRGVLLRFDVPLEARRATDPANYSAERWNYRRTANYGSPHFKPDGSKGQEAMTPSSAYLSKDGQSVFIGIPDMKPVMQMRLGWTLATSGGEPFEQNAYFTPHELTRFDPVAEGFAPLTVNLTPRATTALTNAVPQTAAEGKRIAELMGCVACHSTDGTTLGKVGPSWKGLFGSRRVFADGSRTVADEAYLRESIREPTAKVVSGFDKSDTGMPSYEGVISDAQIEALVLYLKTLR